MRAKIEAQKILDYFCVSKPDHIDLEAFCARFKAHIEYKELGGSEGRISHNGKSAVISVDSRITNKHRKHFIIAHELGHYRLHNESRLFLCDGMSFFSWQKDDNPETEANRFAAEILMPDNLFLSETRGKMISLEMLSNTATTFNSSITATAFRYAEIGNHPTSIVFCRNGKVQWSKTNDEFNYKYIPHGMTVSKNSYAYDFFNGDPVPLTPDEVPLSAWFEKDYKYNHEENKFIFEQCHPLAEYNAVLVILWER